MKTWEFDRGAGRLELEPEFETDLLMLTLVHRKVADSRMTYGVGVKFNAKEAEEVGKTLLDWAKRRQG